jgi:hypothetical protein
MRRLDRQQLIEADTEVAVADLRDLIRVEAQWLVATIDDDEIIAGAVHLRETQLHFVLESCAGLALSGCTSGPLLPHATRTVALSSRSKANRSGRMATPKCWPSIKRYTGRRFA